VTGFSGKGHVSGNLYKRKKFFSGKSSEKYSK
jgi:hypothetical protein